MTNYEYDYQLDDNINENFMELGITTCLINGFIYRGDNHNNIVLSYSPKFYGTYNSALKYVEENEYFKRYSTIKTLRLLKITNDEKNSKKILNFFINTLLEKETDKIQIKIAIVLLQVLFGVVLKKINTLDLTENLIKQYLLSQNINNKIIDLFLKIVEDLGSNQSDTIPSRCSIRQLDKLFMKILKNILYKYNIDGTYYFQLPSYNDIKNSPNLLCNKVNDSYESGSTCVPSEICVFNPGFHLGGVKFWKKINGRLKRIRFYKRFRKNIKKNYNKLSLNDLHLLTKIHNKKR